jgi:hypothetical protein
MTTHDEIGSGGLMNIEASHSEVFYLDSRSFALGLATPNLASLPLSLSRAAVRDNLDRKVSTHTHLRDVRYMFSSSIKNFSISTICLNRNLAISYQS